jgi:hypothetical protein
MSSIPVWRMKDPSSLKVLGGSTDSGPTSAMVHTVSPTQFPSLDPSPGKCTRQILIMQDNTVTSLDSSTQDLLPILPPVYLMGLSSLPGRAGISLLPLWRNGVNMTCWRL